MRPAASLSAFIQALPKTETHLHVEGALPYELLRKWQPDIYQEFPAFRERGYRYEDFPAFEKQLLDNALPWFISAERYFEAAQVMFAQHVGQNVKYVETSFHLPVTQYINIPGQEIIAAIKSAAPVGLEVRVFAGMARTDIVGPLRATIDELHRWDDLDGTDLHGFERQPTEPATAKIWAKLRDAGKITKCHAGEFDGPARVREAIEQLGVTRIQHGIRASEDPEVMRLAADRGVTFDVCPISNVGLKIVPDMDHHPLRKLTAAGIRCTLSTDDPLCFANTVNEEYSAISHGLSFTRKELARFARNGFEVASMSAGAKQPWLEQLDVILNG